MFTPLTERKIAVATRLSMLFIQPNQPRLSILDFRSDFGLSGERGLCPEAGRSGIFYFGLISRSMPQFSYHAPAFAEPTAWQDSSFKVIF